MHRSGTSAFTRSLKVLGVDLGNKLMQPIANVNSKGFFEDLDINQFNDYLLHKMACIWSSCSIPQNNQLELLDNQADIDTAVQLLNNKLENTDLFGFKDPRVSVLLPFWQKIFKLCNLNVSYLIAIRNPLSVAYSLQKRDQFSIKKGLFLWFEYMLASMQQTQNLNRVLVHYENLMLDPVTQINTIAQNLNLTINSQELNKFTNDFLDPNLQHSNLTLEDLKNHVDCNESAYQLYENFLNINASEAYKRPWHRLERGLRLNRIRNFVEAEKLRLVLSDDDTEYLKVKIEKALEKKLLNSKTCVVYDQDKEEIQEIKGLIYHKTADGRMLSSIVDKKLGTTFRRKKDLPQGDASQKQNMKSKNKKNKI